MSEHEPVEVLLHAADLPDQWNQAAGRNPYLRKEALRILEETNPCGQRYHLAGRSDNCSIAVTYQHRLDLLTFGPGSLRIPATMIAIPCSVSHSGLRLRPGTRETMIRHLHGLPGMKLVLNTSESSLAGFHGGATLPTCILDVAWPSFRDYVSAMRSHYRYRVLQARKRWKSVEASPIDICRFDPELHRLYLNVHNRSTAKLEQLRAGFFRAFPAEIVVFRAQGKPIAFVQMNQTGRETGFMFAGMDYSALKTYDTYLNLLLYIIERGIEAGSETIDLGQTTEEVKCKLGCRTVARNLHVSHDNRFGDRILKSLSGALGYKPKATEYRVFK